MLNRTIVSPPAHFHALDLLRGIAALAVVIYHLASCANGYLPKGNLLGMVADHGYLGVHWFFVISGFIIPFTMRRNGYQLQHCGKFLAKRCIRLELPYLASLLLVLIWFTIGSLSKHYSGPPTIWDAARIAAHIGLLTPWLGQQWYLEIYWTLAIEFQFYLLVAVFFPLFFHRWSAVRIVMLGAAVLPGFWCHDLRLIASFSALFAMGLGLAHYFSGLLRLWQLLLYQALCAYCAYSGCGRDIMLAGIVAVAVILGVRRGWKWSAFLGKISYSVYLTHILVWMLLSGVASLLPNPLPIKYGVLSIAIPLCVLFAAAYWRILENPCSLWSKRLLYK